MTFFVLRFQALAMMKCYLNACFLIKGQDKI
jgi:hypothetical protein